MGMEYYNLDKLRGREPGHGDDNGTNSFKTKDIQKLVPPVGI